MIQFTAKAKLSLSLLVFLLTIKLARLDDTFNGQLDNPNFVWYSRCSGDTIKNGSVVNRNLKMVRSSLVDNVNMTGFYNSSYGEKGDKIYGVAQCRGDLNASACWTCVSTAARYSLLEDCPNSSSISITLTGCFLKYSTQYFDSNTSYDATKALMCYNTTENGTVGNANLSSLLTRLTNSAVSSNVGYNTLSDYGVYSLAQCWRDLSMNQCNQCLNNMYNSLELICPSGSSQGFVTSDGCMFQFTTHDKFYGDGVPSFSPTGGTAPSLQPSSAPSLQPSSSSSSAPYP